MPREAEVSLNERSFLLQALQEGIRIDGRELLDYRSLDLQFGDEYGQTEVRLGKTRIAVRISAQVTVPFPDRKFEGVFSISTEISPMASPAFEVGPFIAVPLASFFSTSVHSTSTISPSYRADHLTYLGRPTITETLLSRLLEKAIRRSSALDTESLCLIAGQKCFSVRADVHVLAHDGNLLDASCIAVVAALQHFRRPDTTVEGEEVTVWDVREREPVALSLLHQPLCVSFSYFEGGQIVVVDATGLEERVREGEVVITTNKFGEICQVAKYGGVTVDAVTLLGWMKIAVERVKTITTFIQKRLAEEGKMRDKGGLMAELSAENDR